MRAATAMPAACICSSLSLITILASSWGCCSRSSPCAVAATGAGAPAQDIPGSDATVARSALMSWRKRCAEHAERGPWLDDG
jgi:hypothetical protein